MSKWKKVKLGDISDINMGQSPDSETYNDEGRGIPFYQGNADFGELHPVAKHYCFKPIKIAQPNELLLSVRAPIGAINIANERCCIGRGLCAIKPKDDCELMYLYYVLKYKNNVLSAKGTGSTFKAISKQNLLDIDIPLYGLNEQKKVAKKLDLAYELLKKRKKQLEKLDELVKSRFIEMFGEPVSNPMGWQKKPLADECEIVTGNTPPRNVSEYYGDYIEWIKSDNINTSNSILTTATEYLSEKGLEVGRSIEAGSILMTCIAGSISCIGNVAIANRKVAFNQQINAIVPKHNNTWFMFVQFELSKQYIQSTINMALKGILSKGKLSKIEFLFPPVELQNKFAAFVQQVDKSKSAVQQSIDKLELLKNALMQRYFG